MLSSTLRRHYDRFRHAGFRATEALSAARTVRKWDALEANGWVRVAAHVDPEGLDEALDMAFTSSEAETIKERGVYGVIGEYRTDGLPFTHADSVWACAGYYDVRDPAENPYVVDIMAETIRQFAVAWRDAVGSASRELLHSSHA